MSTFSDLDWIALISITVTTYYQPEIGYKGYREYDSYIKPVMKKAGAWDLSPPGWIFGPIWSLLYALISAGVFILWQQGNPSGDYYASFMSLYVANMVFNKLWSILFFGFGTRYTKTSIFAWLSLVDAVLILLTAIGMAIAAAFVANSGSDIIWITFSFMLVYAGWLVYATYLNLIFALYHKSKSEIRRMLESQK